jgi:hypothetical protein
MPFKSDKQRKWMWANEPEIAQRWEEMYEEEMKTSKKNTKPKMKKKDLVEYIKFKKDGGYKKFKKSDLIGEGKKDKYDIPTLRGIGGQERRNILKYLESLRQSGLINMFGAHPILNWTKDDLHRWLYGQKMDIESLEQRKEDLEYDIENEGEDSDIYESELDSLEEQIEIINYLLDNKREIRDTLIRAALSHIDRGDGNHETRNVQRVFEKMAKDAWQMWVGLLNI